MRTRGARVFQGDSSFATATSERGEWYEERKGRGVGVYWPWDSQHFGGIALAAMATTAKYRAPISAFVCPAPEKGGQGEQGGTGGRRLFVTYGEVCLHASRRLCTLLRDASVYVSFMRCASREKLRFRSTKASTCTFSYDTSDAFVCSQ